MMTERGAVLNNGWAGKTEEMGQRCTQKEREEKL